MTALISLVEHCAFSVIDTGIEYSLPASHALHNDHHIVNMSLVYDFMTINSDIYMYTCISLVIHYNKFIVSIIQHWESVKPTLPDEVWPVERHSHASIIINGTTLVVIGGLDEGHQVLNDCWLLDIIQMKWREV